MSIAKRRREMRRANPKGFVPLNLTPLIDIFTLLVCFLLVGFQGDVQIPSIKGMKLPISSALDTPTPALTLVLTPTEIRINEKVIQPMGTGNYAALTLALEAEAQHFKPVMTTNGVGERGVILLADKSIPYRELQQILAICSQTHFGHVSLAVNKEAKRNA